MSNQRRKILLAVSGMSPQIVTETLYALVTRKENPWIPDEIHLLSTKVGCEKAKQLLLEQDILGKFQREFLPNSPKILFGDNCLHVFEKNGVYLDDIRNVDDSALVADFITETVYKLTSDDNTEIHGSIAGGRKSMSFLFGYAMSLYGRIQDGLSHVLVSEPFDQCPDFFYPCNEKVHQKTDKDGKKIIIEHDASNAKVDLAIIPIVKMRHILKIGKNSSIISFKDEIERLNFCNKVPSIEINPSKGTLICHGVEIKLQPLEFSTYLYITEVSMDERKVCVTDVEIEDFLFIQEYGLNNGDKVMKKETNKKIHSDRVKLFQERKSKINTKLKEHLGIASEMYAIKVDCIKKETQDKINPKNKIKTKKDYWSISVSIENISIINQSGE